MTRLAAVRAPKRTHRRRTRPPRPTWPPASSYPSGCPSATTASRSATYPTAPTPGSCAAPEDWRRHYLLGHRTPPTGAMFLGSRVDDALSTYYNQILDHRQQLTLDQVKDAYRDHWQRELASEHQKLGVSLRRHLRPNRGVRARTPSARADVRRTGTQARSPDRRPTKARVRTRTGSRVDDPVLPRPRDPGVATSTAPTYRRCRLQDQGHPARAAHGRPRSASRPVPRCTLAARRPSARVLLRAGRQARQAAKADHRQHPDNHPHQRTAARHPRADRARRQPNRHQLRAPRTRSTLGVRRPNRLEMQPALLRALAHVPRRTGPLTSPALLSCGGAHARFRNERQSDPTGLHVRRIWTFWGCRHIRRSIRRHPV